MHDASPASLLGATGKLHHPMFLSSDRYEIPTYRVVRGTLELDGMADGTAVSKYTGRPG